MKRSIRCSTCMRISSAIASQRAVVRRPGGRGRRRPGARPRASARRLGAAATRRPVGCGRLRARPLRRRSASALERRRFRHRLGHRLASATARRLVGDAAASAANAAASAAAVTTAGGSALGGGGVRLARRARGDGLRRARQLVVEASSLGVASSIASRTSTLRRRRFESRPAARWRSSRAHRRSPRARRRRSRASPTARLRPPPRRWPRRRSAATALGQQWHRRPVGIGRGRRPARRAARSAQRAACGRRDTESVSTGMSSIGGRAVAAHQRVGLLEQFARRRHRVSPRSRTGLCGAQLVAALR